jgi:mRNA-degrading endonuclease RelE of RelBE toxin-antitoxin system
MPYVIRFTDEGLNDVKALPKNVRSYLKKEILRRIGKDPRGCSYELKPPLEKYRSCHIGDYRVVFYLAQDIRSVAIAGIGEYSKDVSKDVYKKLESLIDQGRLAEKILATLRGFKP